jgi:hypothetical protein
VHANVESDERIKALIATIQIEPDPKKLTALVAELTRLLDGDQLNERPPLNAREITPASQVAGTSHPRG